MTVQEIQEIGFEKAVFGGYDMKSVDTFLERVAEEFAAMQKENAAMKAKMKVLVDKIEEYRGVEEGMHRTLLTAQSIAQETIDKAKKEAEEIIASAKDETANKVKDTQAEINTEEQKLETARKNTAEFIAHVAKLYQSQARALAELAKGENLAPVQQTEDAKNTNATGKGDAPVEDATRKFDFGELQFAEVEFTRCIFHWCIALPSRICVLCIFSLLYRSEVFALRQLCQRSCLRLIQLCYMSDKLSSVLAGSLQFLFLGVDFRLGVFHLVCGFILRRSNDLLCFLLRLVDCLLCNRLSGQQGTVHSFFNTAVFFNFIDQHLHFCLHSSVFLLHRCKFLCNTLEKSIDRLHVISAENRFFKADFLYFLHRHMFFLRLYIICRTDTEKWSGCARPKSAPFVRQA